MTPFDNQSSPAARRRARRHSADFIAKTVAMVTEQGMSIAATARHNDVHISLLRRWLRNAGVVPSKPSVDASAWPTPMPASPALTNFVPMQLPVNPPVADIRVEVCRGATSITVTWPCAAAAECAQWMSELLR